MFGRKEGKREKKIKWKKNIVGPTSLISLKFTL